VSAVLAPTIGAGADVVASVAGAVGSVVVVSEKRLHTIGSHVELSLLGGPPLLDDSS
jgi:basic membrane lipoprotein Med (substrate-binding protein (PBP1-ABC) superfamily)